MVMSTLSNMYRADSRRENDKPACIGAGAPDTDLRIGRLS
jgi:hypothetical protein